MTDQPNDATPVPNAEVDALAASIAANAPRQGVPMHATAATDALSVLEADIDTAYRAELDAIGTMFHPATNLHLQRAIDEARVLEPAYVSASADLAAINNDRNLSPQGKSEATAKRKAAKAAIVERVQADIAIHVGKLAQEFPEPFLPAPSVEVSAQLSAIHSGYPILPPAAFEKQAIDTLRRARTSPDMAERVRCNQLIEGALLPLMQRRGDDTTVESFARDRMATAKRIASALGKHLDVVLQRGRWRTATYAARAYNAEAKSLVTLLEKNGHFDRTLAQYNSPNLFPTPKKAA